MPRSLLKGHADDSVVINSGWSGTDLPVNLTALCEIEYLYAAPEALQDVVLVEVAKEK